MVATKQATKQKALRFLHLAEERVSQGRVGVEPDAPGTTFSEVAATCARERRPIGFEDRLKAARCHAITFHALRHTAASLMVMSGISLRAVQATLGHSTIAVTERYAHLSPSFQEAEADKLSLQLQSGLGQVAVLDAKSG